jgi:hypothetical protein
MKNKSLKITEEKAIELYPTSSKEMQEIFRNTFGEDFFKVEITDKVFDLDSLIKYLGEDPRPIKCKGSTLSSFEKYLNACAVIAKVVEIYNEGTILDWKNTSIYKWIPYNYFGGGSVCVAVDFWCHCLTSGSFNYYKSKELGQKGYNNFKIFYENYWNI